MKLTDPRLRQAKNLEDFRFRLFYKDKDVTKFDNELVFDFTSPGDTRLWGIDISHWNGLVDLSKAKAQGCSFVFIKGCDGSIPTVNFEANKANAKANGIPWGVYNWLYRAANVSIGTQTNAWWNQVKNDYPPLGVVTDFEWTTYNKTASNPNSSDLSAALTSFKILSGKDSGIYSAKGYTDAYLTHDPKWNGYKWWIANWNATSPLMPYGVAAWQFWQFTNNLDGTLLGINTLEGDGDYYWGTEDQFNAEFGLTPTPTTPELAHIIKIFINGSVQVDDQPVIP